MQFELSEPQFLQFGLPPKVETVKTQVWPPIRILRLHANCIHLYRVSYHITNINFIDWVTPHNINLSSESL